MQSFKSDFVHACLAKGGQRRALGILSANVDSVLTQQGRRSCHGGRHCSVLHAKAQLQIHDIALPSLPCNTSQLIRTGSFAMINKKGCSSSYHQEG